MRYDETLGRQYFEQAFSRSLGRTQMALKCPFHDDRSESFSLNVAKGTWTCHAGCGSGGVLDFAIRRNGGHRETAIREVRDVLGLAEPSGRATTSAPLREVAVYPYRDELGRTLYEKVRYEPKTFRIRRTVDGRQSYGIGDARRVLYGLPELITANVVAIVEGEKDADNVRRADLFADHATVRFTVTCNFDGAGKWRDEYGPYFAGKMVFILPDNDPAGEAHAEAVARNVSRYAATVRIVRLPGLADKGDVSDYLATQSPADLQKAMVQSPLWREPVATITAMEEITTFLAKGSPDPEWVIDGVIERGSNGIIVAEPKVGKSLTLLDLVVSCAAGVPWLGLPTHPTRCGIISREDNPAMTRRRLARILAGKHIDASALEGRVYLNTREQTRSFDLGSDEEVAAIIADLKAFGCELAVFDVFRRIHSEDENDNTTMAKILAQLTRIQYEAGCALGLVHHLNKDIGGNIFTRSRGASALHGWTEWGMGLTMADATTKTRRLEFQCKSAEARDPVHFRMFDGADSLQIEAVDAPDSAESLPRLIPRARPQG